MVSSPTCAEPEQFQVRSSRSGMVSSAAARVTVLKTDPGVKTEERKRFRYAPFQRSPVSMSSGTASGS